MAFPGVSTQLPQDVHGAAKIFCNSLEVRGPTSCLSASCAASDAARPAARRRRLVCSTTHQPPKVCMYIATNWNSAQTCLPANQRPCSAFCADCAAVTCSNLTYTKPCRSEEASDLSVPLAQMSVNRRRLGRTWAWRQAPLRALCCQEAACARQGDQTIRKCSDKERSGAGRNRRCTPWSPCRRGGGGRRRTCRTRP